MRYFITFVFVFWLAFPIHALVASTEVIDGPQDCCAAGDGIQAETYRSAPIGMLAVSVSGGLDAARSFLTAHSVDSPDWSAIALQAGGGVSDSTDGVATDLARRILALHAIGRNTDDLAVALEATVVDGHVGTNSLLNDDIFALLALRAAGRSSSSEPLASITSYVVANQRADGGWGVATTSKSDVDDTSSAIESLVSVGGHDASVGQALSYLHLQQNSDGGFPFRRPSVSNSASTSWALHALEATGESTESWSVNGITPIEALLAYQGSDGGFFWQATSTTSTALLTAYAVIALEHRSLATPPLAFVPSPPDPPVQPPPTPSPPPVSPLATNPTPPLSPALEESPAPSPPPLPPSFLPTTEPSPPPSPAVSSPIAAVQPPTQQATPVAETYLPPPKATRRTAAVKKVLGASTSLPASGSSPDDILTFALGLILAMTGIRGLRENPKTLIISKGKELL
ncbi:MAG: terpene cyclase/mutase family protein [Candidatus Kerfeldbacteria bacterium]|nr:terpene cyclase/mutase family protein [Candidatus Kerfeldbacteria bacterium]